MKVGFKVEIDSCIYKLPGQIHSYQQLYSQIVSSFQTKIPFPFRITYQGENILLNNLQDEQDFRSLLEYVEQYRIKHIKLNIEIQEELNEDPKGFECLQNSKRDTQDELDSSLFQYYDLLELLDDNQSSSSLHTSLFSLDKEIGECFRGEERIFTLDIDKNEFYSIIGMVNLEESAIIYIRSEELPYQCSDIYCYSTESGKQLKQIIDQQSDNQTGCKQAIPENIPNHENSRLFNDKEVIKTDEGLCHLAQQSDKLINCLTIMEQTKCLLPFINNQSEPSTEARTSNLPQISQYQVKDTSPEAASSNSVPIHSQGFLPSSLCFDSTADHSSIISELLTLYPIITQNIFRFSSICIEPKDLSFLKQPPCSYSPSHQTSQVFPSQNINFTNLISASTAVSHPSMTFPRDNPLILQCFKSSNKTSLQTQKYSSNYHIDYDSNLTLRAKILNSPSKQFIVSPQKQCDFTISLQNNGETKWPKTVRLDELGGIMRTAYLSETGLDPYEIITVNLSFQAPSQLGSFKISLRLCYETGQQSLKYFGPKLSFEFQVNEDMNFIDNQCFMYSPPKVIGFEEEDDSLIKKEESKYDRKAKRLNELIGQQQNNTQINSKHSFQTFFNPKEQLERIVHSPSHNMQKCSIARNPIVSEYHQN